MKYCAVVVTYNRKELLKECINALQNQTIKLDKIIIINNNCTDGTTEYLKDLELREEDIKHIQLSQNVGGAGGFHEGIKYAYNENYDMFWIMDDDTIPYNNSFEELLKCSENPLCDKYGFICSHVEWIDGTACNMNIPAVTSDWNSYLKNDIIKVKNSSFVSVVFNRSVIEEFGLPIKEFFIWGDDTEFTLRISKKLQGYMAINSVVQHKMNANHGISFVNEEKGRIDRYFYRYRNKFYIAKKSSVKSIINYFKMILLSVFQIIFSNSNHKIKKILIILKGFTYGLFFNPSVEQLSKQSMPDN